MRRRCKSALGNYLAPLIYKFLLDNAKTVKNDSNITIGMSMEDLAHAIEFGWSKAWSSPIMQSAFSVGIAPAPVAPSTVTAGGPIGTIIYNVLKLQCIE